MSRKLAAMALAAAFIPVGASLAATGPTGWTRADLPNGQIVYTTSESGSGLAFGCTADGKLSAFVNIDGADMVSKLTSGKPTTRTKPGKLTVDGGEADKTSWTYMPDLQIMSPKQQQITRRLYNAAITGDTVQLELRYMDDVSIAPPAIDSEFTAFSSSCKETSGA